MVREVGHAKLQALGITLVAATPLNATSSSPTCWLPMRRDSGTKKGSRAAQGCASRLTDLFIKPVARFSEIKTGKLELNSQTVQLTPLIDKMVGTAC